MSKQIILGELYEWHDDDGSIYYGWRVIKDNKTVHGCSGYGDPIEALNRMNESHVIKDYESKCSWSAKKIEGVSS